MRNVPTTEELFRNEGRLQAFSDGVFAIAITLLILEIKVPPAETASTPALLWAALVSRWPSYFAFLLSFSTIFIAWSGHHILLQNVRSVPRPLIWTNGLFLLCITFLPFPTALVAEHLSHPSGTVAAAVYAAVNALNAYMFLRLSQVARALSSSADVNLSFVSRNSWVGVVVCTASVGLAFVSPVGSLLVVGGVWLFWSLPQSWQVGRAPDAG